MNISVEMECSYAYIPYLFNRQCPQLLFFLTLYHLVMLNTRISASPQALKAPSGML